MHLGASAPRARRSFRRGGSRSAVARGATLIAPRGRRPTAAGRGIRPFSIESSLASTLRLHPVQHPAGGSLVPCRAAVPTPRGGREIVGPRTARHFLPFCLESSQPLDQSPVVAGIVDSTERGSGGFDARRRLPGPFDGPGAARGFSCQSASGAYDLSRPARPIAGEAGAALLGDRGYRAAGLLGQIGTATDKGGDIG
jgi:hypothetical protein